MPTPPNDPPPTSTSGERLAGLLANRGIADRRVLDAIAATPRDLFVPEKLQKRAWDDAALPIGHEQTISQPYMVALMTQELALCGSEKVLEIGTGSGYQTAILARLAHHVDTIERHRPLAALARSRIQQLLGLSNVAFFVGDGTLGHPAGAPFDRILVTAAAPELPEPLFDQLAEGGRIVLPIGSSSEQTLSIIDRRQGQPELRRTVGCRFVPLIGRRGWTNTRQSGPKSSSS